MMILSPYLFAVAAGWLVAHVIKYVMARSKGKQVDFTHQLFISGGMPSSHATTSIALLTVIGLKDGFETGLFGLAALFALIVCYDAVKVRRSSGEQGEAIQKLIKVSKIKIDLPRSAKGHTPTEVIMGCLLGVFVGLVVFFATK